MRMKIAVFVCLLTSLPLFCIAQEQESQVLRLEIGNDNLKDKRMTVSADKIYSSEKGKAVPFSQMIEAMRSSRFVYVGETHNSLPMHDIQLRVIQALHGQDKNLSIVRQHCHV